MHTRKVVLPRRSEHDCRERWAIAGGDARLKGAAVLVQASGDDSLASGQPRRQMQMED